MGLELTPVATGIAKGLRAQFTRPLYVLWGIVGLILLVACVNLANLMLARATARTAEMSVRVAIGASHSDVRWMVLERALRLSSWGIFIGLALSSAVTPLLRRFLYGVHPLDPAVRPSDQTRI